MNLLYAILRLGKLWPKRQLFSDRTRAAFFLQAAILSMP